ncbi:MAG TPA: hypothetical protein PLR99_16110 [Polyangiaceae bacterium]|jgi:hypothetical protein|nr:hypothetical protein [Polyangiaceae bacterium]
MRSHLAAARGAATRRRSSLSVPALSAVLFVAGCATAKPRTIEMVPIGTNAPPLDGESYPTNKPPPVADNGQPKGCNVNDVDEVAEWLKNDKCKIPASEIERTPGLSEKLEWKLTASTNEIVAGGRVDLMLTLKNKSSENVALIFNVDGPSFTTQSFDPKGKRIGEPSGKPKAPSGVTLEETTRTVRLNVSSGATLKTKLFWDAVKLKWAPDKIEGSFVTPGTFPTVPAGNLKPGTYTVRLATSLNGVSDESLPKLSMVVTKD